jgi:hypothetical protein
VRSWKICTHGHRARRCLHGGIRQSGLRLPPGVTEEIVEGKALIAAQHLPSKSGRTLIAAGAFKGEAAAVIVAAGDAG